MAMVEDPVCGMRIESEEAAGTIETKAGRTTSVRKHATTRSRRTRAYAA